MKKKNYQRTELVSIFLLLLFVNLSVILDLSIPRIVFSFIYLTFIPGYLVLKVLNSKFNSEQTLFFSIGLSLLFNMLLGLLTNQIGIIANLDKPLMIFNILFIYNLFTIISLFIIALQKTSSSKNIFNLNFPKLDITSKIYILILFVLMWVMIFSKVYQYNFGNNYYLFISLIFLCLVISIMFFINSSTLKTNYKFIIYIVCLILLLSSSLTSVHLSGDDVFREFSVFQSVYNSKRWEIPDKIDVNLNSIQYYSYYSMLSITILPTIYQSFLNINPEFVYKIIYQVIFALFPVILYSMFNKIFSKGISVLAVLFIIVQSTFTVYMQTLIRQEIAFLFIALSFYVLMDKQEYKNKNLLLIFFLIGIALSHYTSNYIFLILLIFSYLAIFASRIILNIEKSKNYSLKPFIFIFIFALFTMFWTINTQANYLLIEKTLTSTFESMKELVLPLFESDYTFSEKISNFITLLQSKQSSTVITSVGNTSKNPLERIGFAIGTLSRIFIVLGVLSLILSRKKDIRYNLFMFFQIISLAIMFAVLILPVVSIAFNLERLYLQLLLVLAPAFVMGGYFIFDIINNIFKKLFKTILFEKNIVQIFLLILILSHFLFQSTLVYALAGETKILFSLDTGSSKIVNEYEILAGEWVTEKNPRNIIVSDFDSKHKIELADPEIVLKTEFYYYQWWEGLLYQGQYAYVNTNDLKNNPDYVKLLRDDNKIYDNKLSYVFSGK